MHYVISDVHGCYDKLLRMLELIRFSSADTLYFLGDAADRGPQGLEVLLDLEERENVIPFYGNHEDMFLQVIRHMGDRVGIPRSPAIRPVYVNWTRRNGGDVTWAAYRRQPPEVRQRIRDYIEGFKLWEEVTVNGRTFLLAHAGVGEWEPEKDPAACSLHDFIWYRMDYSRTYYKDKYLVTGHTPTVFMGPEHRGRIFRQNNHIMVDCGAVYTGVLGCLCLETLEEFYTE